MRKTNASFRDILNQSIDLDKVLKQISHFASFSCSQENIEASLPLKDHHEIQHRLRMVQEIIELEHAGVFLDFSGCSDISLLAKKAEKQMVLSGKELVSIVLFCRACSTIQSTLKGTKASLLLDYAQSMDLCWPLIRLIEKNIDASGDVKMDATPKLLQTYRALTEKKLLLQTKGRNFVKKNRSKLMEEMTTFVQGRLSVLVRAQDKNTFGGMVHGQSQSGQAFYVEPSVFVSDNNQIQSLEIDLEQEKQRICKECSRLVGQYSMRLISNLETMTTLDEAYAKGRWAVEKDGCIPVIQTRDRAFRFEHACHPLIDAKQVVPNTYACSSKQNCLMISGPNMGGKTVTLKTIGLFVVLAHAGFPVLCHHAYLPFYRSFWFDIGDQQSIENNLSTFSSHISTLSSICQHCDDRSFILVDELGNGTDPSEGACLAVSILTYFIERKCTVITSTHFHQVKTFGKTNPHILVSSVEFDQATLKPTYRYIEGVSGASYAFHIASQYHLIPSILEQAQKLKEMDEKDVDRQLEKLEKMQNEVRREKERFDQLIQKAHDLQREAQEEKEKIIRQKERMDLEYQQELDRLLDEKQEEAKNIIRELRKQNDGKMHKQSQMLHQLHTMAGQEKQREENTEIFQVGDYVQIKDVNTHGEIIELRKKEAVIESNGMRMKIKTNRLKKIRRPNVPLTTKKKHTDKVFRQFPLELNIIGMRVEEGMMAVDRYLDQALAHGVKQVRIIHGLGTGKLRSALWKDLEKHPAVRSKASGGPSDGGLGATIVVLK